MRHPLKRRGPTFRYTVAGKDLEGEMSIRHLTVHGLVHYEGLTIRALDPEQVPAWRPPAVGAQSLTEPLPAAPGSEFPPSPEPEAGMAGAPVEGIQP